MSKFTIDGVEYEAIEGPDDLTFGEADDVEAVTGLTVAEVYSGGKPVPMRFMRALSWVAMRRVNPEVSFDDLAAMKIGAFAAADPEPAEVPTDGEASTEPSPSND